MPERESAGDAWAGLDAPWREALEAAAPQRVALARAVARRLGGDRGLPRTAGQALEQVWDLLCGHGN